MHFYKTFHSYYLDFLEGGGLAQIDWFKASISLLILRAKNRKIIVLKTILFGLV